MVLTTFNLNGESTTYKNVTGIFETKYLNEIKIIQVDQHESYKEIELDSKDIKEMHIQGGK